MKIRRGYLVSTFLTSLICIPVFGEVEPPLPEDPATLLIGQANPILVDIEPLTVVIVPPESYQRALALFRDQDRRTRLDRATWSAGLIGMIRRCARSPTDRQVFPCRSAPATGALPNGGQTPRLVRAPPHVRRHLARD